MVDNRKYKKIELLLYKNGIDGGGIDKIVFDESAFNIVDNCVVITEDKPMDSGGQARYGTIYPIKEVHKFKLEL